jgi:hypothetical protein
MPSEPIECLSEGRTLGSCHFPSTFMGEEEAGRDIGMGPSQLSCDSSQAWAPGTPAQKRCQNARVGRAVGMGASALQDSELSMIARCGQPGGGKKGIGRGRSWHARHLRVNMVESPRVP